MLDFFIKHWPEIILSLVTAGALGLCKYAFNQLKNYKNLLEKQDQSEIMDLIKRELKPIAKELQSLRSQISLIEEGHNFQLNAIVDFYKFKLIKLCKGYLEQEYITASQFEELSELHKIYNKLGGNSQGDEYYEKAKRLPVKDEE